MQVTQETFEMAILAAPFVVLAFAGLALVLLLFLKWKAALLVAFLALLINGFTEQIPFRFSPNSVSFRLSPNLHNRTTRTFQRIPQL